MFGITKLRNKCAALEKERDFLVSQILSFCSGLAHEVALADDLSDDDSAKYHFLKENVLEDVRWHLRRAKETVDDRYFKEILEESYKRLKGG